MSEHGDETLALLKLSLCKGIGPRTVHALVAAFGSARAALTAGADELSRLDGIGPGTAEAVARGAADPQAERELDLMERYRVRLVPHFSEDYPPPLCHLEDDAPPLLRMRGDYRRADPLAVAVVGSRRCSAYGRGQASRFAADLAGMGFTVVSGMAQGIDSSAHSGALAVKGRTLAVLGCGLAHTLSGRDAELALAISENGALLSELPMEVPPLPGNFPPRNRLIAGLCLGVVVVEAAERSGSLITARLAAEQGRAVFAVPGSVDSPTSRGTHRLIRDGAVLVQDAREVVEELGPLSEPVEVDKLADPDAPVLTVRDARAMALNEREKEVHGLLEAQPQHIDDLIARSGLPPSIVSSILLTLEIRGLARQLPGQRYATN